MLGKIIIGSPAQIISCIKRLPAGTDWKWCYFGLNIKSKDKIESLLLREKRYYYSEELYKISHQLKTPFLDWIAGINACRRDDLCWWSARLASKSPYQTNFFLLFCYFNLVYKWALKGWQEGYLLILIEDPYLHRLLQSQLLKIKAGSLLIKNCRLRLFVSNIRYIVKAALAVLLFLWRRAFAFLGGLYLKAKFLKKFKMSGSGRPQAIIYTHLDKTSFKGTRFEDIYKIGSIADIYRKAGINVHIASSIGLPYSLKEKVLQAEEGDCFLAADFYLRFIDCLKALFSRPVLFREQHMQNWQNVDYGPLFLKEHLEESSSTSFRLRLCLYYAYKNYFFKNKAVRLFIYPFENQPWEKMVLMAIKDAGSNTKTAGYQHSTVPQMEINHFLGRDEYKVSPAPDYIVTNSAYHQKIMDSAGFRNSKVINGGSIRYKKEARGRSFIEREKGSEKNILFLLSPTLDYSMELIYSMKKIVLSGSRAKLFVKPHPGLFSKSLQKTIQRIAPKAAIVFCPLDEILDITDTVVYSATTAALEALNRGIPVYKINTELVDLDILQDLKLKIYRMTEKEEIDLGIINFNGEISCAGDRIIAEPVKEDAWLSLLIGQ